MAYGWARFTHVVCRAGLFTLIVSAGPSGPARAAAPLGATATPFPTAAPAQPASAYPTFPKEIPSSKSGSFNYSGKPADFELTGLEPDFDPIYKLIVSTKLHDLRAKKSALPDSTLILSAYLEVFQPDTTPVLPDLLHPNQPANDLAGFLSGAAAIVNAGGHVVYKGSLLAEVFQDSTEHLIIDLDPINAKAGWGSVRLQGPIVLHKGGMETGTLKALQPFAPAALAVPPGHVPTWQAVIKSLTVHIPPMMGTAGTPGATAPATPATIAPLAPTKPAPTSCAISCRLHGAISVLGTPSTTIPIALGVAILCLAGILARRRRHVPSPPVSPSPPSSAGDE
jgi:hypothetical protein